MARRHQAERTTATMLTFQIDDIFREQERLPVPLLRLMAATNDARYVMTQVVRGNKGGRQPGNRAELRLAESEQFYLIRTLAGHLYEAAAAFRSLWDDANTRKRLKKAIALDQRAIAREKLAHLIKEFGSSSPDRLEIRVLEPIRNHWAFHYLDSDYRDALHKATSEGFRTSILLADVPSRSRYLLIDDFHKGAVVGTCSKPTVVAYREEVVKPIVALAGALGIIVDSMLLGLLRARGMEHIERRDFILTLDRGLARGQRDARERKLQRESTNG